MKRKVILTFLIFIISLITIAEYNPYINKYIPPEKGEADYHNPYVEDYCYADIHHRLGKNCPKTYYINCEIWKIYGELYLANYITKDQLIEIDHYIFYEPKGVYTFEEIELCVYKYFTKRYGKIKQYDEIKKDIEELNENT